MITVQCHGVFDILHMGHVRHLQAARALGDRLVVSITPDDCIGKGPGRPYLVAQERAEILRALSCVDDVVIAPDGGTRAVIHQIRPDIFVKGVEYNGKDMSEDEAAVREIGGRVVLLGESFGSSSAIINQLAPETPITTFCRALSQHCPPTKFQEAVESFSDLKVMVIGEGIYDEYTFVRVQGLTSKNRVVSAHARQGDAMLFHGGAWAVASHIRDFTSTVRPAIVDGIRKQRFIERGTEGHELTKLFAVTHIEIGMEPFDVSRIADADVVFALDYGHGLFDAQLRDTVQQYAKFLVLNCQTNSANFGYNLISKRWKRADAFALDEQELTLDAGDRDIDLTGALESLREKLGAKYAWLTRGPVETVGRTRNSEAVCPPFETNPIDTVGAGDAFLSVAGLAAAKGLPIDLATFMGQLAGAQAVKIVGNEHPISKAQLIRTGMAMLA